MIYKGTFLHAGVNPLTSLLLFIPMMLWVGGCKKSEEEALLNRNDSLYRDLSYGNSKAQGLDLCFPVPPKNITEPLNVIVFIHGGGWQAGDKSDYTSVLPEFSKNMNCLAASMNYRMFGDNAHCHDMLEDITSVLSFIKGQCEKIDVPVKKVILMGASAGGHLTLLYSYKNYAISPIPIAFCIGQCAPADFTDTSLFTPYVIDYNCLSKLTGEPVTAANFPTKTAALNAISPVYYVSQGVPPTIFCHGTLDELVPVSHAFRLQAALEAQGVDHRFFEFKHSGHALENDPATETEFGLAFLDYYIRYVNGYPKIALPTDYAKGRGSGF